MPRFNTGALSVFKRSLATVTEAPPAIASETVTAASTRNNNLKFSDSLVSRTEESLNSEAPHFRVGSDKRYFPKARVILLRPNAKHTPYQAKFIVPKSFNKLDLRDYLFHIYGLRALNITTQLLPGRFIRTGTTPRYRSGQIKKMTIDMEEPFIWPGEQTMSAASKNALETTNEAYQYTYEMSSSTGSDKFKPSKAFEGLYKFEGVDHSVESFIPKFLGKRLKNEKNKAIKADSRATDNILMEQFLKEKQK
ncbi:mitochondrial 54S ribosomal protein YmL41 [Saccharomycopsis crataegensis]|uniref:Large ribosomal subunit protein uL23m n=1 Tax=Saccharomycopsis crataegensis TaxID=43959 RepID=A0AAV5QJ82_9ASCO|nr:mitochondrial 54S ribosomal protein YmL41 [Saccharomycopsis crataegensis]